MRNIVFGLTIAVSATFLSATGIAPAFASAQAPVSTGSAYAGVITI